MSSVAIKEIVFPDPSSRKKITEITSIVITDHKKNGKGGSTQITKGGVGNPFVYLRFKNHDNPIDLGVEIYGVEATRK